MRKGKGVIIKSRDKLTVGNNVGLNDYVWMNCAGGIEIGNDVNIGPFVKIHSANHNFDDVDKIIMAQGHTRKKVVIGNDVWIGMGAIIVAGVTIGTGSVIGAGAVVTRDIPPYSIAVGNPARFIRKRGKTN